MATFRDVERDHTIVRDALFGLFAGRVLPRMLAQRDGEAEAAEACVDPESIMGVIKAAASVAQSHPWDDRTLARLEEILGGAELTTGYATPQATNS